MPQSPRWGTSRTCSNQNYPRCSPLAHPRGPPHLSPRSRGARAGTYSADFQKCPGWERRRLRFGSFSSMSMSLVKVGRSSCS